MVEAYVACVLDTEALGRQSLPAGGNDEICLAAGYRKFYEYYQISRDDESDEAETEPKKEGELATKYEGSHSPFGLIWQIANATGWSREYILNGVNYQTLILMLADAPRYIRKTEARKPEERDTDDVADFFQSNLQA